MWFVSFVLVQLEIAELNLISFQAPYCKVQCMCFQLIQSRKDNSVCWMNITSTVESGIYVVLWYFLNIPYLLCGFKLFISNKCSRTNNSICEYSVNVDHPTYIHLNLPAITTVSFRYLVIREEQSQKHLVYGNCIALP